MKEPEVIQFQKIVNERLRKVNVILGEKGKEYSRNNNPFHNFDIGARMEGKPAPEILDGFLLKHIISYKDMIKDIEAGKTIPAPLIEEKFGDIITYFIIQEALIKIRHGQA